MMLRCPAVRLPLSAGLGLCLGFGLCFGFGYFGFYGVEIHVFVQHDRHVFQNAVVDPKKAFDFIDQGAVTG